MTDSLFKNAIDSYLEKFESNFKIQKIVESRDFHRYLLDDLLQVDFVADRVYRHGIIEIALKKAFFELEDIAYRIKTFDPKFFRKLDLTSNINITKNHLNKLAEDILEKKKNKKKVKKISLCSK